DRSARAGACSITRATAPGRLLAGASQAIGKHLRDRTVGLGVAPEFRPKRNSALIGSPHRSADDAARLEIGDKHVAGPPQAATCPMRPTSRPRRTGGPGRPGLSRVYATPKIAPFCTWSAKPMGCQ